MCFDSKSSLLAFTLAYSISWYLFERDKNYDRWIAGFIIVFSSIQLLEAGLWKTMENPGSHSAAINDLLTRLILVFLLLQPLMQSYLGYKYTKSSILGCMSILFLGILMWGFYRIYTSAPGQFNSTIGDKGHLVWSDALSPGSFLGAVGILYMIGLFLPPFFMKDGSGWPLILIGALTALYSFWMTRNKEFGSLWCFTAVAISLVAIFM
jgi:hypothetical protein